MSKPETPAEMKSRLELMTEKGSDWDLSDNDKAAIRWALNGIANLENRRPAPVPGVGLEALEAARCGCGDPICLGARVSARVDVFDREYLAAETPTCYRCARAIKHKLAQAESLRALLLGEPPAAPSPGESPGAATAWPPAASPVGPTTRASCPTCAGSGWTQVGDAMIPCPNPDHQAAQPPAASAPAPAPQGGDLENLLFTLEDAVKDHRDDMPGATTAKISEAREAVLAHVRALTSLSKPAPGHPDIDGLRALCTAFRDWEEKEKAAPGSSESVATYDWMRDIWLQVRPRPAQEDRGVFSLVAANPENYLAGGNLFRISAHEAPNLIVSNSRSAPLAPLVPYPDPSWSEEKVDGWNAAWKSRVALKGENPQPKDGLREALAEMGTLVTGFAQCMTRQDEAKFRAAIEKIRLAPSPAVPGVAKPLVWTKEKPTVGGHYHLREFGGKGRTIVFLSISDDGEERVTFYNGRSEFLGNIRRESEWAGPIPEPGVGEKGGEP